MRIGIICPYSLTVPGGVQMQVLGLARALSRALVMICGNPVIAAPDAGRLDAALPQIDAMISLDNALNETSRHADVILPGLSALEQPHCDELLWGWATRSAASGRRRCSRPMTTGPTSGRSSSSGRPSTGPDHWARGLRSGECRTARPLTTRRAPTTIITST